MNTNTETLTVAEMKRVLEAFIESSTPEQLREELQRGDRPFLQTLEEPVFLVDPEFTVPAYVSFYEGEFLVDCEPQPSRGGELERVANRELALAA
jgi:hypothetical protein